MAANSGLGGRGNLESAGETAPREEGTGMADECTHTDAIRDVTPRARGICGRGDGCGEMNLQYLLPRTTSYSVRRGRSSLCSLFDH